MGDVLGADRLLHEATVKGGAHTLIAMLLEELMQPLDVSDPRTGPTMNELGEVGERRRPELQQMLPLQVATRALAGHGRHRLGPMLRQR